MDFLILILILIFKNYHYVEDNQFSVCKRRTSFILF